MSVIDTLESFRCEPGCESSLNDVAEYVDKLKLLCRSMYRVLELVSESRYLDEDEFARIRGYMDELGLWEGEQE